MWELTKNWNSFMVKKRLMDFSRDPYNLSGRYNASDSGKNI